MTLMLFQSGQLPVMVCDDLASRGLDTLQCQHVIQYEFAKTTQSYMHRIGRVGRMSKPNGLVTNFVRTPQDAEIVRVILKGINSTGNWDRLISNKPFRLRKVY